MTHPEALEQIDLTLDALLHRLDALDHDAFDVDSGDGKLTLEFEDGVVFILSRQSASHQIWMAEPAGGWHFNWDGAAWRCSKRGIELVSALENLVSAKVGEPVDLR